MTEWQPIETAPKDGKFLIAIYTPTTWVYNVQTAIINRQAPEEHRRYVLRYATHWMSLPPPPEQERSK